MILHFAVELLRGVLGKREIRGALCQDSDKMNSRRLYLVEAAVLVVLALGIVVSLVIPAYTYHFHTLSLNFYQSGAMDFSTDTTSLVRSLGVVALATMVVGALVGTAIGITNTKLNRTVGIGRSGLLQKFVRQYSTEQGTKYELTNEGLQFLREYAVLERQPLEERVKGTSA
jgi:Trk-type K+ transport system membrane component